VHGQVGNGDVSGADTPAPVQGGIRFAQIVAGVQNTCARTAAGAVYCWGLDVAGDNLTPVLLSGLPPLVTIATAWWHVCGLTASGQAYCWGSDNQGQTGDGAAPHTWNVAGAADSVVGGLTFISIGAGQSHSCGLVVGGAAYCWGANGGSQLGRAGSVGQDPTPGPVQGGLVFSAIFVGYYHTCALTADGTAYCWGSGSGALGDGGLADSAVPVAVSGGLHFAVLGLGDNDTCGRTLGGQLYCWGINNFGELGDGTRTARSVPTFVH
jgi:alpha-tubulin suppressor-like RCC1 family protein